MTDVFRASTVTDGETMVMDDPVYSACPLPEVAEALGPYIHTREETERIRRIITSALQKDGSQVSKLNAISLANGTVELSESALSGCTGVRKAYFRALQAHQHAQQRLETLRAEIKVTQDTPSPGRDRIRHDEIKSTSAKGIIDQIRSSQRHEKLCIIEEAFARISAQAPTTTSLDYVLNETPVAPKVIQPRDPSHQEDSSARVAAMLLELKKTVLQAQSELNRTKEVTRYSENLHSAATSTGVDGHIHGLREARATLIALIEGELANVSEEPEDSDQSNCHPSEGFDEEASQDERAKVISAYEQYIEARQLLVMVLDQRPSASRNLAASTTPSGDAASVTALQDDARAVSYAHLLPLISGLRKASEDQQSLMQQSAYLRRQMSLASTERRQTTLRLADESLMVEPGSTEAGAWAAAATEARTKDAKTIAAQVEAGKSHLGNARDTLGRIDAIAQHNLA